MESDVLIILYITFPILQGLMTPIIRNADQKTISSISKEVLN